MAVSPVKTATSIGYSPASAARAPGAVRDAVFSSSSQISELQGAQLTGTRTDASTPDGFEGLGPQAAAKPQVVPQAQVPSFGSIGLAPMAYFAQERADAASSGLARGLGPQAASKGAGTYEFAKRTIQGGPENSYRYS